jgi:5-methylcytosine-specific restriction endonuclease McrA
VKRCSTCRQDLPWGAFCADKRALDGKQARCKECTNLYHFERRRQFPERYRRYARVAYHANHEAELAKRKAWVKANPEKHKASRQRYYEKNREAIVAKAIETVHRRRDQRGDGRLSIAEWREILDAHGHRCAYCQRQTKLTRDHVVPLSRGGRHVAANIVPACKRCNVSKSSRLLSEWRVRWYLNEQKAA